METYKVQMYTPRGKKVWVKVRASNPHAARNKVILREIRAEGYRKVRRA